MTPEESHAITIEGYTALRKEYDRLSRMYQEQKAKMDKKEQTHTPGPWYEMTKRENKYQSSICQEATGKTIALTYTSNDADARLIAAAPELLQALKAIAANTYTDAEPPELRAQNETNLRLALQAIAKAEGL